MARTRQKLPVVETETLITEDAATGVDNSIGAKTLHPGTMSHDDPKAWSKTELLNRMIGSLAKTEKHHLVDFFNDYISKIGDEGKGVSDANYSHNTGTIKMKPSDAVAEDVKALFAGQELSEEFLDKTATLFEAAVQLHLKEKEIELEEQFETRLEESLKEISGEIINQIDAYMDNIVDKWLKENELALVSQIKSDITEGFLEGLRDLFAEHYIGIPEEKTDLVEALTDKVTELEEKFDELLKDNQEKTFALEQLAKEEIFDEIAEGLTIAQAQKLALMCESIDENVDIETFEHKVKIIKENQLGLVKTKTTTKSPVGLLTEGEVVTVEVDPSLNPTETESEDGFVDPEVSVYAKIFDQKRL